MHCPNCGKPAQAEQQFCRACGMSLVSVGELVAQHAAAPVEKQKKSDRAELEQAMVRKMINWLICGIIVLGIGVFLMVLNKSIDFGKWFSFVATVLMLGGLGIASAGVLSTIKQGASISHKPRARKIGAAHETEDTREIDETPYEKSLPPHLETAAMPSITERTTQLISVDKTPAKQREES